MSLHDASWTLRSWLLLSFSSFFTLAESLTSAKSTWEQTHAQIHDGVSLTRGAEVGHARRIEWRGETKGTQQLLSPGCELDARAPPVSVRHNRSARASPLTRDPPDLRQIEQLREPLERLSNSLVGLTKKSRSLSLSLSPSLAVIFQVNKNNEDDEQGARQADALTLSDGRAEEVGPSHQRNTAKSLILARFRENWLASSSSVRSRCYRLTSSLRLQVRARDPAVSREGRLPASAIYCLVAVSMSGNDY